ncbi:MAG TPA: branched-chain amino acid ABC transporter permease [Polyangiaceae bacterium]
MTTPSMVGQRTLWQRNSARGLAAAIGIASLLGLVPTFVHEPMLLHVLIMVFVAVAQGAAWNILGGYAGQHSVGHAAYFGMGAYSTMMTIEVWHQSTLVGIALATSSAVVLALGIGTITFRLRGPYFVLASISVAEIIRLGALECKTLTRGAEGILLTRIPTLELGNSSLSITGKVPHFYASLGLAVIAIAASWTVLHSKLGYYLQAIREDQDAARSLGINLTLCKNIALCISATFTAWAGSLWALYVKFLDPNLAFGLDISVQMVLIAIIGGIGTILGPVIGAIVLVLLSETLRNPKWLVAVDIVAPDSPFVAFVQQYLSSAHVLFYGILVVVVILFAPDGLMGVLRKRVPRWPSQFGASRHAS